MKRNLLLILVALLSCNIYSQSETVSLRIMTYNIRHGAGMDDVVDLDRQAKIIQDAKPDVVGLQEVDSIVPRSGKVDETGYFAEYLGMYGTYGPAIPLSGGKYGVAILSKERPMSVRNTPLPGKEPRTLLVCEFQNYVFACTHLDLEEANRIASLPIIIEEASRYDKPFFICGDWNDTPSSTLISKMKQDFAFLNYINNTSSAYTFPANKPTSTIDYIASYGRVVKSIRNRKVLNEPVASDHRPVILEVRFDLPTSILPISTDSGTETDDIVCDLTGKRVVKGNKFPGIFITKSKRKKVVGTQ